jgi:hypothetical protein
MSGVYTNILKRRADQSKNNVRNIVQTPSINPLSSTLESSQPVPEKPPVSPSPRAPGEAKQTPAKKQISAYLSHSQHTIFKQLYHKLNSTDANVEKGEIVGLSLEVLSALLADDVPNFPTLTKLRDYVFARVAKP